MNNRVFACPKGAGPSPPRGLSWKQLAEPRTWAQLCLLPSVQVKVPVNIKDPRRHACLQCWAESSCRFQNREVRLSPEAPRQGQDLLSTLALSLQGTSQACPLPFLDKKDAWPPLGSGTVRLPMTPQHEVKGSTTRFPPKCPVATHWDPLVFPRQPCAVNTGEGYDRAQVHGGQWALKGHHQKLSDPDKGPC